MKLLYPQKVVKKESSAGERVIYSESEIQAEDVETIRARNERKAPTFAN